MSELEIECTTEMFLNFAADFLKAVREEEAKQEELRK